MGKCTGWVVALQKSSQLLSEPLRPSQVDPGPYGGLSIGPVRGICVIAQNATAWRHLVLEGDVDKAPAGAERSWRRKTTQMAVSAPR